MDEKLIQSALREAVEGEVPSVDVRLWSRVSASFDASRARGGRRPAAVKRLAITAAAVCVLMVAFLISPQGQALAQRLFQFFAVSEEHSRIIPTQRMAADPATPTPANPRLVALAPYSPAAPTPTVTPDPSCSTPASQTTYFCQVKAVEDVAGFNAKEFLYAPKGTKFTSIKYDPATQRIQTRYDVISGGGWLTLTQGTVDMPENASPWGSVPADTVEMTTVNGWPAEITVGLYVVDGGNKETWRASNASITLAWQDDKQWYILSKFGDPYAIEWITENAMITLAEGLVDDSPPVVVPVLDPEYLTTVEQAEALAGYDVPVPSLLPEGYELKRALWVYGRVVQQYGSKNKSNPELHIWAGPLDGDEKAPRGVLPAGVVEEVQVGPWQGWYWRGIFHTAMAGAGQPTPTPAWQGDADDWTLVWYTDTLRISISYSPGFNTGKEVDRDTLIRIAESME